MTNFVDLGLNKALLTALTKAGYETPTPIQARAIPALMDGRDLLGVAQTGTGKTAAFALPILHRLAADRKVPARRTCRVLVLSPTRELASQIAEAFKTFGGPQGFTTAVVYGGVKYGPQIKALSNGLDILVATPGRLLDHVGEKVVDLSATEVFVLDEADQMLDLGFVKPIRQIVARMPKARQNLFFSATMPGEIGTLAGELLNDPVRVEVTPQATTAERVSQSLIFVETAKKRAMLTELFAEPDITRALVFSRTKHGADRVAAYLQAGGVEAAAIHGDKSQGQRERALQAFRDGRVRALVATDIAARGIDVQGVSHVINYDLPLTAEAYVHRIGRTARAGAEGVAISLCSDDERKLLRDIQRVTRQTIPSFDRRRDKELAALDAAILAAKPADKPTTPERVRPPRAERPERAEGERGSFRKRRRFGGDRPRGDRPFGDRPHGERHGEGRPEGHGGGKKRFEKRGDKPTAPRYDPLAAERAGPGANLTKKPKRR